MVGRMYWSGVCVVERSGRWRDDQDKIWRRFDPRYVNRDAEEEKKKKAVLRSRNKDEEGRKGE